MIALEPDARIDAYRLIRPLGRGGFAEVWEAQHETDGRRVALKVLTELRADSERALERFEQEGRLAASLASPRCVYVFGAGAFEGCPYIAMELMAGGTLSGRIQSGPLPTREAVDCVLDVLEGLEAAQRKGILHRDVKPSNVFLGADGHAKIGDFGISKSLESDAKLSQTGAFLGTPYYASPEQIAAEPLDLRSDLYSVGAMLYEILTGKLPYLGTNPSAVLAQVLTREPVPFAQTGVPVPPGLQQIVMRLLAKQREKRFQTYDDTREALLPFSSRGLTVAPQLRRLGAIVIDLLLFAPLSFVMGTILVQRNFRGQLAVTLTLHLSQLTYFTLMERYGAASLGKRLLGLRVTTADGATAGLPAVLVRTLVFLALYAGPGIVTQQLAAHGVAIGTSPLATWAPAFAELLGFAIILMPMRAKNGYAGAHELLTGTRVMALAGRETSSVIAASLPAPVSPPAATSGATFGPYRGAGIVWSRDDASLTLARDETLSRDVWIHSASAGGLPPLEVVRERGAGSLPWLQRGTAGSTGWDAYGAPAGDSLAARAASGLDWGQMRVVLRTLAAELADRFKRQGTAGVLSPYYVWVDPQGRALLLDFPATGNSGATMEVTPDNWRMFLKNVATVGLRDASTARSWPAVPLPEHGRTLLASLSGGTGTIEDFVTALERVSGRPTRVTRLRRLAPLGLLALVPVGVVALRLVLPAFMAGLPAWYQDLALNAQPLIDSLRSAEARAPNDPTARRTADAIRIVLARDRIDAGLAPQIGKPALDALPPRARADMDSAALRYPAPDAKAVADARAWLEPRVPGARFGVGLSVVPPAFLNGMRALGYLGVIGVLLGLALRGGLLFTLFGIAVQRPDGSPATRLRCVARSLVAWSPVLLLAVSGRVSGLTVKAPQPGITIATSRTSSPPAPARAGVIGDVLVVLAIGGAAVAVWRPARGVAERIAGVVLVPK
jgi:uncharacterized RDD family membrane protein YckC